MSSFNFCDLPFIPMETVLKKLAAREVMILSSMIKHPISMNIDGFHMKFHSDYSGIALPTKDFSKKWRSVDPVREVMVRYDKLWKVFKGPINYMSIDPMYACSLQIVGLIPDKCRKLRLESDDGCDRWEEIDLLLDRTKVESLIFSVENNRIIRNNVFSIDSLKIETGRWVTSYNLLSSRNRLLQIVENELTEKDVNAFIKKWLDGGNDNLEVALIESCDDVWSEEALLDGIDTVEFDIANRDEFYFPAGCPVPEYFGSTVNERLCLKKAQCGVYLGDASDIRRADGTWASVEYCSFQFRFFVWKDPRPSEAVLLKLNDQCDELRVWIHRKFQYLERMEVSESEREAVLRDVKVLEERLEEKYDGIEFLSDY